MALGDGIGIDAIRLASAGFSVDYMDYDSSNMSKIASFNFLSSKKISSIDLDICIINNVTQKYDAVVCLEVIEHVSSPFDFSESICNYLKDDGLLFISECFNGIENRWPTHLYTNERYSGLLPFILLKHFKLMNFNQQPFGKPFVFAKSLNNELSDALELLLHRITMISLVNNQLDVGF